MKKICSLISVLLTVSLMTACEKNRVEEMGTAGGTETIPAADTVESAQETAAIPDYEDREPVERRQKVRRQISIDKVENNNKFRN